MAQKKVNDVNVSSKEVPFGTYSTSSSAQRGSTSSVKKYLDPLEDLNERLSVWDPNLPDFSAIFGRFDDPQVPKMLDRFDEDNEENSPYEEVRVVVRNYDEDIPCSTVRAWVLGIVLVFVGASVNTVFSLRKPAISLSTLIAQLVSYVLGTLWAKTMPTRVFTTFGRKWTLNPGPFNVKEHTLIVVMANVSYGVAYATDIILAQVAFYKQDFGIPFQLLLMISTQSVGYGIAGLQRKFLVYPASMIWPTVLPGVTLMYSLHEKMLPKDPTVLGGNMSRYRWFFYITAASFIYYWIPGFLAQFLSIMAFVTWIYPQSPVINQLFGGTSGLSLLPLTLDWTTITGFVGNPLVIPWHAISNILIGLVIFYIFLASGLHYSNTWFSQFLPMSDSQIYDNTANVYEIKSIVTPQLTLDEQAYKEYSPLFLSTTFAISYGLSFAAIAALIVHTYLYHGKELMGRFRKWRTPEVEDIHLKLMRKYKEVPEWWYLSFFFIMIILSVITIYVYPTHFVWWAFLLAIGISTFFALPIGMIQAQTGISIGLNVLTEFIMGYIQPGRPLALMLFKTYGYITMVQGLSFVSDLKFGHYMKIPPRQMFSAQVIATLISCFIQVAVLNFALDAIPEVCTPKQPSKFTCPDAQVFFSASVIWGLLGPARIFSPGQIYSALFWFFLIGALTPVLLFFGARRFPSSPLKYLSAPLIFGGSGGIPPATPINYLSFGAVGWVFQYWIRRNWFKWWARLNYLTSAGLDLGLAMSTIVIFLAFTLQGIKGPQWWGNTGFQNTMDTQDTAIQVVLPQGQTFGPKSWS